MYVCMYVYNISGGATNIFYPSCAQIDNNQQVYEVQIILIYTLFYYYYHHFYCYTFQRLHTSDNDKITYFGSTFALKKK